MKKRILLVSNALSAPFDEGKKNIALSLHKRLEEKKEVLSLSIADITNDTQTLKVDKFNLNRFFFSIKLRFFIRDYSPDIVIYVPDNSCTFGSFFRVKMLKLMTNKAKVVMMGAQHREYTRFQDKLIKNYFKPDLLLLLGRKDEEFYSKKGFMVKVLPPAVDCIRFSPATKEEKEKIRNEFKITIDKKVVLHVGHLNSNRNIESLLELQKISNVQVVIVGSTTTKTENNLKEKLVKDGIRVIDEFVSDISKVYKMSDVYIFPVFNNTAAIDMPLSVLEAMACNIPVLTTRFGGLVDYFEEDMGFRYFTDSKELAELVRDVGKTEVNNNKKMELFTWDKFVDEIITICDELK